MTKALKSKCNNKFIKLYQIKSLWQLRPHRLNIYNIVCKRFYVSSIYIFNFEKHVKNPKTHFRDLHFNCPIKVFSDSWPQYISKTQPVIMVALRITTQLLCFWPSKPPYVIKNPGSSHLDLLFRDTLDFWNDRSELNDAVSGHFLSVSPTDDLAFFPPPLHKKLPPLCAPPSLPFCKPRYVNAAGITSAAAARYPVSLAHLGGCCCCCCWAVCLGIWARKLYSIDHARYQHTIIWVNHVELWQIHLGLRN